MAAGFRGGPGPEICENSYSPGEGCEILHESWYFYRKQQRNYLKFLRTNYDSTFYHPNVVYVAGDGEMERKLEGHTRVTRTCRQFS